MFPETPAKLTILAHFYPPATMHLSYQGPVAEASTAGFPLAPAQASLKSSRDVDAIYHVVLE